MSDVAFWEQQLIKKFVIKSKRDRYLQFLKGPKHRSKVLERLNHAFDYDSACATILSTAERSQKGLLGLLRRHNVADTCYLMADGNNHDGHSVRLEVGVEKLVGNHWGAILICPPKPIAVYKAEDVGEWVLLEQKAT